VENRAAKQGATNVRGTRSTPGKGKQKGKRERPRQQKKTGPAGVRPEETGKKKGIVKLEKSEIARLVNPHE